MSDADFTVRNYDACSHRHDVRPRLLAGWQARDAVFCNCAVFCWRFGGIWEYLSAGAANLSEEGQKGQGMRNFFKKIDETVREMWLGTFLWGCLCELVSVWWVKDRLYSGLGILIGMLLAMAGIWHMWKVLDTALELGDGAQKYATSKNLLRYAVVLVVFAVLMLTHFADPLAAFAGLMGMKASAYLQPFIRGYKEKKRR